VPNPGRLTVLTNMAICTTPSRLWNDCIRGFCFCQEKFWVWNYCKITAKYWNI